MNRAASQEPTEPSGRVIPALHRLVTTGTRLYEPTPKQSIKSEIHPKGRSLRPMALASENAFVEGNAPRPADVDQNPAPLCNSLRRVRWHSMISDESPTEPEPTSQGGDDHRISDRSERTGTAASSDLTSSVIPHPSTAGAVNGLRLTEAIQTTEHSWLQAPNLQSIPENSSIPGPSFPVVSASSDSYRINASRSNRRSIWYNILSATPSPITPASAPLSAISPAESFQTYLTYETAHQPCERKMLIIGSSYDDCNKRLNVRFGDSLVEPLKGLQDDVDDLASGFRARGYDIEIMTCREFSREDVLHRMASFLSEAPVGDVRVIVFTGHTSKDNQGSPCVILPGASSMVWISAYEWYENIRAHARPGVIVLSIFATCFSGAFAENIVRIGNFTPVGEVEAPSRLTTPLIVTLGSSGPHENTYESSLGQYELRVRDHFLWSLAKATRNPKLQTWNEFMVMLQQYFAFARSFGSTTALEGFEEWLRLNPQSPVISVTPQGKLPAFNTVFPAICNQG
ncbi:hypothetical protein RhiJN_05270 [Ceratobasidium sp. AG-Ba]|nr:hypothetical protein RhiJN_05270 [Ceratobasidium sp. AG-Ba]QRW06184.1 hypothetical protein RhiLY_05183 [Ceratobasidium sp. AG-Ba]